ncbi:ABC transporter permease [Parendozoicomonas haliclonae]|uniref:Arginine ABC transporter permease protein ArtM n=1 Tax=Parendozoicomonas haliclonae TaxID=1960125 RepID=A0A1X7AQB7_9GAMM|nr:ABC transporter permease [Parendozoicomonas haliclonae]SMA50300.1 Octopine transport system permease protein OccM [Parendozoicomonas haliclonae]
MDWSVIAEYYPRLLEGSWMTLKLVILSSILGLILAIPMALARVSESLAWNGLPRLYIFFFRGTPLLIQIFLFYYGLSQFEIVRESALWPYLREPYWCAIIVLGLHTAAYVAEILRGALQAIPRGEVEACRVMGMTKPTMYRRILLPRAFGIMMPAYGNEVILMLKGSALASTITLLDLTGMARTIIARTYTPEEIYIAAGVLYLLISWLFMLFFKLLDRLFNRHQMV